jgi:hypothetical protein
MGRLPPQLVMQGVELVIYFFGRLYLYFLSQSELRLDRLIERMVSSLLAVCYFVALGPVLLDVLLDQGDDVSNLVNEVPSLLLEVIESVVGVVEGGFQVV